MIMFIWLTHKRYELPVEEESSRADYAKSSLLFPLELLIGKYEKIKQACILVLAYSSAGLEFFW
jgi:hypothetical protein